MIFGYAVFKFISSKGLKKMTPKLMVHVFEMFDTGRKASKDIE